MPSWSIHFFSPPAVSHRLRRLRSPTGPLEEVGALSYPPAAVTMHPECLGANAPQKHITCTEKNLQLIRQYELSIVFQLGQS